MKTFGARIAYFWGWVDGENARWERSGSIRGEDGLKVEAEYFEALEERLAGFNEKEGGAGVAMTSTEIYQWSLGFRRGLWGRGEVAAKGHLIERGRQLAMRFDRSSDNDNGEGEG